MDPKRVLVVYYSRAGTTPDAARAVQHELGHQARILTTPVVESQTVLA